MEERWETIEEFPDYAVSSWGNIANMKRGAMDLRVRPNRQGHVHIGLVKDGRQSQRSVAVLVASAFVPGRSSVFNTPIHLDGDHHNCQADNLAWRPRWFAIKYHKQFRYDQFHTAAMNLVETNTGATYDTLKEACVANGIYFQDVIHSCYQGSAVFPTNQEFSEVE